MADQIKPRYRLGIQWHLDNAKDDATKIPERTLFQVVEDADVAYAIGGDVVVRSTNQEFDQNDKGSVRFVILGSTDYTYLPTECIQPLI